MLPREFFIEDRLEKYRKISSCNLGESGFKNFKLGEIFQLIELEMDEFKQISLEDSSNRGMEELRLEISLLYENINLDEILVTTGTSEALYIFFRSIIKKGDRVGYFSPAFQALYEIPLLCGAIINPVNILHGKNFEKLFRDSELVILNHPHNPTGITFDDTDWEQINFYAKKYKRVILFDEHYRFLDNEKGIGKTGYHAKNTFATGSITKSFGTTGLRIGWIVGDKEIISKMRSFKDYLTHTVNPISEFLALKLLKNKNKILPKIISILRENQKYFMDNLNSISSLDSMIPPSGGLVAFPKLKDGIFSEEYADNLHRNCDVFVLPGTNFEMEGYIRIGFGESKERFKSGINRWIDWEKIK
jgi:aspartate/methionine/tyrosine aminotransferase